MGSDACLFCVLSRMVWSQLGQLVRFLEHLWYAPIFDFSSFFKVKRGICKEPKEVSTESGHLGKAAHLLVST